MARNVDLDLPPEDWRPRSPESPRGRLRMQVISVERAELPIGREWCWCEGWRFLSDQDPAPIPARELVRFTALPPEARPAS
jgi:hypothetical protein